MSKSLLQLTPYALVELDYSTTTIGTEDISFILFDSSYTNSRQILNETKANNPTSNILDRSAARLTNSRTWGYLDQDRAIPYDIYDSSNLPKKLLSEETATNWPVSYETIRLHLLSGYNLEDLDGLLLSIEYPEVSGKVCTMAQIAYLKGDEYIKFNARPIVISGRTYDRYIEVKVPSLYYLNNQFYTTPTSASLAYWLTSDNNGFDKNGLISITLRELTTSTDDGTTLILTSGEVHNVTFKQTDAFSLLTAVIKENEEEDCFEYYPSWQGGFIEDLVSDLNGVGGDYYVFHELYIYEQVGFSQVQTDYFVAIQEGDFNGPKRFRPILRNGDSAYSFSIDYVMRLTDRGTGAQIIRTASVTSFDPKSFGRKIEKVNLDASVKSFKIYNKIIEETKLQVNKKSVERKVEKLYTPTFFDFNEIAVNTSNVILKTDGTFTTESVWNWDVIFGQGEAILLIHPFENYVKFKMHRYLQDNVTQALDLRYDVDLFLVIEYAGKQVKFSKIDGFYSTNLAEGEVIFKIPNKEASAIYTSEGGIFYITSKVPSFIKVRVMDNFVGGIAGREINVISKEYYSKGETDIFELLFDGSTYFVPKNMLQVIQVIPSGSGVSETTLYTGKWRRMQDADKVKDDIENIRKAELERVLNQIRSSQLSLNSRQTEIDQKAAELAALEAKLAAQSVALTNKNNLLTNLQQEISGKDKILNQRERELRENAKKAADAENQNIARFQEQVNKILKSVEDQQNTYLETLEELKNKNNNQGSDVNSGNQGTGNQGSGNQGSGNQGSGNQGSGNQGSGNQGSGNQGSGNQGSGNQGTGNQGTGNQGSGNQGTKTVVTLADIHFVDFVGVAGNDMAVLPGLGLQPQNKDTGLNTFNNNTFISNMGPINSGIGFVNFAETPITNTFGSGTAAPRNNNFSDPTYNLTPLQRERNRNVNNNAENNSGAGDAPPAGNTEKIVYGKILDWDNKATDEILRKPFFNLVNKKLETINVFRFTQFTFNGFISQNRRVVVQVESIKYLSVGDIIYSTLETEISSVTNQKKRFVKIEIKNIIAPNKIEGIYVNLSANGEIPLISFMQTDINIAPFSERHAWDIIKKPSSGSGGSQGNNGGGGGGDNGTKIPL
jgi:hypothetical protein